MSAKARTVKWQKLRDIKTKKNYNGETSPYWKWVDAKMRTDQEGRALELPLANPDMIEEAGPPVENVTRKIMKKGLAAIKFSPKEAAVLKLLAAGLTQEQVAARLEVSRSRVAQIIIRIQKKGEKFLGNKLAHGSLISAEEEENL